MDAHRLVTLLGIGRVAVGAAYALAPQRALPLWIGRDGGRPGPQVVSAAFGSRDVALGLGTLQGLREGRVRPGLLGGLLSDGADLVATLRARDRLPAPAVAGVVVMAGAAIAAQALAAAELD